MNYVYYTINTDLDMDTNQGEYYGYGYYLVDASAGNITIQLPGSGYNGMAFVFNRIDNSTNTATFQAKTGFTVNGASSITLGISQFISPAMLNNTNWLCPCVTYT